MAENTLLSHYKVDTLFPSEWPAEKDQEDSSDEEGLLPPPSAGIRKSKSRYSALERSSRISGSVPGAQRTKDGVDNLVQRDETDALTGLGSVAGLLRNRGLPIEVDNKLRNRFFLSSTTFSPSLFLSQIHRDATTEDLVQGLNFLSRSIEQKSASLKVLVESNFDRFVRAKATIDNVYKEMVGQGLDQEAQPSQSKTRLHSRQSSRNSAHFRKTSGPFSPTFGEKPPDTGRRKNALSKETEYGVLPIKKPLSDVSVKAEEVWGPAIGGREREGRLKTLLHCAEKHHDIFEIGANIADSIKRKDYEFLVEEYVKAKKLADESQIIFETSVKEGRSLSDLEIYQIFATARMWADAEEQIEAFKRDVWRKLAGTHFNKHPATEENKPEEHMELISILLELGVEDNPIWVWLFSRYDYLRQKIAGTFERSKVEIEILRRRLSTGGRPALSQIASHLQSAGADGRVVKNCAIDSAKVIEVWEHIYASLNALISTQGGVLGEVIEFWETAQSFIGGKAQRSLPAGIDGNSRKHHRLSMDGVKTLSGGATELINLIRDSIFSFFTEPPVDDLSMLLSPIPPTPTTPKTPKSATFSPFKDSRYKLDPSNIPPPSPKTGDTWEKFAFWPPHANALSGVFYLSKILLLVGTAACNMAALKISDSNRQVEQIRSFVTGVRETSVHAVCAAWGNDAEYCRILEDWTRAPERRDLTHLPTRLMNLEGFMLWHMQKMLYISEATKRADVPEVIIPPSGKLLQLARSQFVACIFKVLNGMKENTESPLRIETEDPDGLVIPSQDAVGAETSNRVDSTNKNVRILLTLSNIQALRNEIIPHLITQFENNFTITLSEESSSVRDVLGKIDSSLFNAYVFPISTDLDRLICEGISSPSWAPRSADPVDARPYVYTVLLRLVLTHTEVSTTATPLTSPILKNLVEQLSQSLISSFKQRSRYNLPSLMQATLDVEFLAQTLKNYTTDKASDTQSAIYVALDERTDDDARQRLQAKLKEMGSILKKLREGTRTEFGCFKRQRVHPSRSERPSSNRP